MIELSIDAQRSGLQQIARALKAEEDGKRLKRELAKNLRTVMEPIRQQMLARLMRVGSGEMSQAIARSVRPGVRFSGRNTGVSLVQRARGMPRNFPYAGRAFNRVEGWHPKNLGGVTIHQVATPVQWFDEPTKGAQVEARLAVIEAVEDMSRRLAARTGNG